VAVVAVLCAACSGGSASSSPVSSSPVSSSPVSSSAAASSSPAVTPVPGISAEVVRLRTDVAVGGRVQVRVTDTGAEPFTVTAVALDSPGFAPLPRTALTAEFTPGRVIDLPTPYGQPVCSADPAPVTARLTVTRPAGATEEVRVPLAGDDLDVVHREECAVAAVRAVVDIALTGAAGEEEAVTGTVVLTRHGDDDRPVTVTDVRRSVLFDVAVAGLPVELGPGQGEVSTVVTFTSATCEPHVLAETKQPFLFPLQVAVGEGDAVPVPLPVDEALQGMLWDLVQRVCG
jgi:hypothetical protein